MKSAFLQLNFREKKRNYYFLTSNLQSTSSFHRPNHVIYTILKMAGDITNYTHRCDRQERTLIGVG
jgi:hypothetical protein